MVSLAKRKLSAGAVCGAAAALLIGSAALGEDAPKEIASLKQEGGAGRGGGESPACLLAFTPDGKLLMSGNKNGAVFSYEVPSLKPKNKLSFSSELSWFGFTTDGKTIVAAENKAIVVRDTAGEDEPKTIKLPNADTLGVDHASLAADNKTVAVGVGRDMFVWDIVADKQVATFASPMGQRAFAVAISPDGKSVVSAAPGDAGILWDVATAKDKVWLKNRPDHVDPLVRSVAWSANGKLFATAESEKMAPCDVHTWFASGAAKNVLSGHEAGVTSMAFLADGKTLVTGSMDKTVKVWDVSECAVKGTIKCSSWVNAVAVSPDGKLIAVAVMDESTNNLFLYNLSDVVK
jgi:WD40 repeat protein